MSADVINLFASDPEKRQALERRFWSKVSVRGPSECWPWIAKAVVSDFGYGALAVGGGVVGAHRVAFALSGGRIVAGMYVRHTCDNPKCCNPEHLLQGTPAENVKDMMDRGRHVKRADTPEIRAKLSAAAKNRPTSEHQKQRARQTLEARWADPAWRQRFSSLTSGEKNPRYGKRPPDHQLAAVRANHRSKNGYRHSDETKEKIRESWRLRKRPT